MLPIPGGLDPKIVKYGLIAAAVVGGGFFIIHSIHSADQNNAQSDLDNTPEAQQANNLLKLLHPYSYKQFNVLTSLTDPLSIIDIARDKIAITDKNAIVKAGSGIKNFDKVSDYYKKLTKDALNLPDDLRNTLSNEQEKAFYREINIRNVSSEKDTTPFYIYANPSASSKGTVVVYEDSLLKKPLIRYAKGTKIGKVSKLVSVPFTGKDGVIIELKLYYLKMDSGKYAGRYIYVLQSQVSKTKPQ